MSIVNKDNYITVVPSKMEDATIKWQQSFTQHEKQFKVVPFIGSEDSKINGTLFIEEGYVDAFFKMCEKDASDNPFKSKDNQKVKVTDEFQYGQDSASDTKIRFLVFHDKSDNIYQHRFMKTTAFSSVMGKVSDAIGAAGDVIPFKAVVDKVLDAGKAYVGDPLRNF